MWWIELRELLLHFPSLWVLSLVTYCYCLLLLLSNHMFEVLRWQFKNTIFFPQLLLAEIHKMMKIEYQVDWIWSRTWRHGTVQDLDFGAILGRALGAKNSPGLTTQVSKGEPRFKACWVKGWTFKSWFQVRS